MEPIQSSTSTSVSSQTLAALVMELNQASKDLARSLQGPNNSTFNQNARKERVTPASRDTKLEIVRASDAEKSVASSPHLSQVQTGNIVINKTAIAVNPSVDSFFDVLAKINSSGAGVKARFNPRTNKLFLTSDGASQKIDISKDTSNFLTEANISLGTYKNSTLSPSFTTPGSAINGNDVVTNLSNFRRAFNRVAESKQLSENAKNTILFSTQTFLNQELLKNTTRPGLNVNKGGLFFRSRDGEAQNISFDLQRAFRDVDQNSRTIASFYSGSLGLSQKIQGNIDFLNASQETLVGENVDVAG